MGSTDGLRPGFRQAEETNLALLNQILHRACNIFHWHVGIDSVLIVEINIIGTESSQAALNCAANLSGLAVNVTSMLARILIDIPAKLCSDLHLSPNAAKRFPNHDSLVHGP